MSDISRVRIANLALTKLGAQKILSFEDGSTSADRISTVYDSLRDAVLQEHPWNFALGRAILAPDGDAPAYEYTYKFLLPLDCLRIFRTEPVDLDYKIEGGYLLANTDTVYVKYIKQITNENMFSPMFVKAFSTYLAHEICYATTNSTSKEDSLMNEYNAQLVLARSIDSQEDQPDNIEDQFGNTWFEARA